MSIVFKKSIIGKAKHAFSLLCGVCAAVYILCAREHTVYTVFECLVAFGMATFVVAVILFTFNSKEQ